MEQIHCPIHHTHYTRCTIRGTIRTLSSAPRRHLRHRSPPRHPRVGYPPPAAAPHRAAAPPAALRRAAVEASRAGPAAAPATRGEGVAAAQARALVPASADRAQ